ncbi:MAG TPA: MMPL family transporter, partial [Solirubrobacterales bacterium]|nr:MMPL family transporter [Solirubrobacterales bacterium]
MRCFASWTTSHRAIVIAAWIAALIGIGILSGAVGSDFSEEFKLPESDSQEAFDLLETKFPAQSGETATIVFKADGGVDSPAVKEKMDGVFAKAEKLPHVSEVVSPYGEEGAADVSKDGKIAYATVQWDVTLDKLEIEDIEGLVSDAHAVAGDGLQVELGGQPIELVREKEEGEDSSFMVGLLAAVVVLLLTFGSVVAMGLPIVTALFAL